MLFSQLAVTVLLLNGNSLSLFIDLFLAALGLCGCTQAFSSCDEQRLLSSCGAWASHCSGFSCGAWALGLGLSTCVLQAQLPLGIQDRPGPGIKPMSPALAGRFLTTGPPEKSQAHLFFICGILFQFCWSSKE